MTPNDELIRALRALDAVAQDATRAVRELYGLMDACGGPTLEPDQFEHTDDDGDSVTIGANQHGSFMVNLGEDGMPVRLDHDAVNRLAQYLDQHRTDLADTREPDTDSVPCWTNPIKGECGACGHYAHGSEPCSEEEHGRSLLPCPCRRARA